MCYNNNHFTFELHHKNIPITQKRKPGRPAITKKALQFQDNEFQNEYIYSDSDNEVEEVTKPKTKATKRKRVEEEIEQEQPYDIFAEFAQVPTTSATIEHVRTSERLSKRTATVEQTVQLVQEEAVVKMKRGRKPKAK